MDDAAFESSLELAAALGWHTRGLGDLLRAGVCAQELLARDPAILSRLPPSTAKALSTATYTAGSAPLRRQLDACDALFLPFGDRRYPAALRDIPDPPPWLFCRGDPRSLALPMVAVVGSRRASHAGLQLARTLAARLAVAGYAVCSGLAIGIDGAAHRGALDRGTTVAVLGTGIDACYPKRHGAMATEIMRSGCLLSELPPETPPHQGQFPRRNRIISGLSTATVIVEAALPSGSLHTAAAALEQGREVFVFPWSVLHRGGAGCLYLLRDGATPLTDLDELDDHFPPLAAPQDPGDSEEERLLALIGDGHPSLQALQRDSGHSSDALLALLGRLEATGRILRQDGGYALRICKSCQRGGSC